MGRLRGEKVIVTGSTRSAGAVIAEVFAAAGAVVRDLARVTAKTLLASGAVASSLTVPVRETRSAFALGADTIVYTVIYSFVAFAAGLIIAGRVGAHQASALPFIFLGVAAVAGWMIRIGGNGTSGFFKVFRQVEVVVGSRAAITGWRLWDQTIEAVDVYSSPAHGWQSSRELWLDTAGELRTVEVRREWSVRSSGEIPPSVSTLGTATDDDLAAAPYYEWSAEDLQAPDPNVKRRERHPLVPRESTYARLCGALNALIAGRRESALPR